MDGHRVVDDVFRREDVYEGERVNDSPDVIVELNLRENYSYTLLPSARVPKGTTWRQLEPSEYPGGKGLGMNGTHRQHGVLALWGDGVRAGATIAAGMPDIAPTLLHLMGEAVPAHMDGSVLMDGLMQADLPLESEAMIETPTPTSASDDEAEAIRARLARLGYL